MLWKKKKRPSPEASAQSARENLFLLLDRNMATHLGKQEFWHALHALDKELTPGSLRVEPFVPRRPAHDAEEDLSAQLFTKGMPTLVIPVKHRETAQRAVRALNKIFAGCGTEFVLETTHSHNTVHYQIRSNIDKQHWDKLCVFCQYRFEREIAQEERPALMQECEQAVADYTRGTDADYWHALEGVPAFISLMGLHGLLRPKAALHSPPNKERKQIEFDTPNPRGTPLVFEGIQVHVELRGSESQVVMTPYTFGFNAEKEARRHATADKSYGELLLETFGGNPFDKRDSATIRAIHAVTLFLTTTGFGATLYGISKGAEWLSGDVGEMIGWIGPAAAAGAAGSFVVFTYLDHKWRMIERIDGIRKGSKELKELEQQYTRNPELAFENTIKFELPDPRNADMMQDSVKEPYTPSPIVQAVEAAVKLDRRTPPSREALH